MKRASYGRILAIGLILWAGFLVAPPARAQAPAAPSAAAQPEAAQPAAAAPAVKPEELSLEQAQIAEKFKRFEQVVKLLAQFSDETDADQARLLRQVFAESKSRSLDVKFDALVKALGEKRLAQAVTDQD